MKNNFITFFFLFTVHFIITVFAFSLDKDKVFEKLQNRLLRIKSVKIDFEVVNSHIKGVLFVDLLGKYRLELKKKDRVQRIITSNGKTVWNYSPFDKKVVVSNFETDQSLGLQNFFERLGKDFSPISYERELNSLFGSRDVLILKSKSTNQIVKVYLDEKLEIKGIQFNENGSDEYYKLLKIDYGYKHRKGFFEFKIPKGIEVIDLR